MRGTFTNTAAPSLPLCFTNSFTCLIYKVVASRTRMLR